MSLAIEELIVGDSPAIQYVRELVVRIARSDLPVLIQGPTGSGKEQVARALHAESGRVGRFVAFNVCAVADSMFEDALFGHVRGSFTGAVSDAPGYLLEADRGTLFLDEIAALASPGQAKLLRAVETKEFRQVGARCDRRSDFRVVAATNQPIAHLIETGDFRQDLARRLRAITIDVPPLADRLGDIPALALHFAHRLMSASASPTILLPCALTLLQQYHWPDNCGSCGK